MNTENFEKEALKYDSKVLKLQELFNKKNNSYVHDILIGKIPEKLSQQFIESIEENSLFAYYYKLRILANKQSYYFGGK